MADILTQLQTCLDQLATQFYATLCYLSTYHDHSPAIQPPDTPSATPQLNKIPKNPPPTSTAGQAGSPPPPTTPGAAPAAGSEPKDQQAQQGQQAQAPAAQQVPTEPTPDDPDTFMLRQRELARDLIIKEQQIEYLVSVLPGVGSTEAQQEERIKELAGQLRVVEEERRLKRKELRRLGERVDEVLGAVARGI